MPTPINHAARHKSELEAAIAEADLSTLDAIDADLAREGWGAEGRMRQLIATRRATLTTPPAT